MHILVAAFQAFLHLLLSFNTLHTSATRLPLVHRDHNLPSPHDDYGRFEARMKRDAMRVASLTRRLAADEVAGIKMDLQHPEGGEYFVEVGVGTPPQTQTLVMDTGSDLSWVKCQCDSCTFDPKNSKSFADVGCNDLTCYKVNESDRGCDSGRCTYKVNYGDGTETNGTMAMESITIWNTKVPNVPIGCSHETDSVITETGGDGVLGLSGGSLSIMSQSGGLLGGVFSYCLGNPINAGWLGFGFSYVPKGAYWLSLLSNPKHPSYYYIDLARLAVAREVLDIPADTFQLNFDTGEGGVILDTGTVVTRLANGAYEALRDKFKEKMGNLPTVPGVSIFDTCYNLAGVDLNTLPNVSYIFYSHGFQPPSITLESRNVLYKVTDTTYCLAFAPSTKSLSIIGNMQQQGIQVTIETVGGSIGFGPGTC